MDFTPHLSDRSQPLKILHCTAGYAPAWQLGGPPRSTANLCEGLAARGHRVVVFTTKLGLEQRRDLPDGEAVERNGVTVHYFPLNGPPGIRSSELAAAVRERAKDFDLMHVTGVWQPPSIPACRAALRRGIPYVVSPRGMLSVYSFTQKWLKKAVYWWGWERRNLNGASAVHYTALAEQDECRRLLLRPPGFVVPNSIDLRAWRPDAAGARAWRARHAIKTDEFVFLNSGRLHHKKGLDLLIQAAHGLPENRPWRLVFAGPDEDGTGRQLRQAAAAAGLGGRVIFTGPLETADLAAVYSAAGLFVFPSLNENFGNVAIEALACGTRLVLSPEVGCHRELADVAGVAVVPRVVANWRAEMAAALDRAPLAADVQIARRHALEARYSAAAVASAMEAAYGAVLAKSRSARAIR